VSLALRTLYSFREELIYYSIYLSLVFYSMNLSTFIEYYIIEDKLIGKKYYGKVISGGMIYVNGKQ